MQFRASLAALLTAALFGAGGLAPAPVAAGVFYVVPVGLNFNPRDRAVAVTLVNQGTAELSVQAELYEWRQRADGSDELTPTDDLFMAPPIAKLAAKSQQVFRVLLARPADPARQLTYRMIVRELDDPQGSAQAGMSIPLTIAMNLPVFVTPAGARRALDCGVARSGEAPVVWCENAGKAHALIRSASLRRNGTELARFEGGAYVLASVKRPLPLEVAGSLSAGPAKLSLTFDDEKNEDIDVVVP